MAISSENVKLLREMTGAGMLDCKKALEEANGDIEKAKEILRIKGLAKADKKASRETKEGLIVAKSTPSKGAMIELACETDFVARNDSFKELANKILDYVLENVKDTKGESRDSSILQGKIDGITIEELLKEAIAKIGENIQLKRYCVIEGPNFSYIHGGGRIGVLLAYEGENLDVVKDVALQIAAMRPEFLSPETVPQDVIEREKAIYMEQAKKEGKPENMLEKIAEGKLKKFYEEKALLNQKFIKDEKKTIQDYIKANNVAIKGFCRFEIGA